MSSHITRTASWLPPAESWPIRDRGGQEEDAELPYGWEQALDNRGKPYYINHVNKTTTYVAPEGCSCESPPAPRDVELERDPDLGFGFVAGSEKPVLVRFVTDNSPSVGKLEPGDQILCVNGEDVSLAAREHVISAVRACADRVTLRVCQPARTGNPARRSALLSAAKRARLRAKPPRVRFADSVQLNGAPMYPPSAFSLGDLCLPPMANVLKVFLENGQTKSFKYDATTTVADVVGSLRDKLCITADEHFSLVVEHVKGLRRNKLTLLDPKESLARIAAKPGSHKMRCLYRVAFVPSSAGELAQRDLAALDYLYLQCCNDVAQERFSPELQPEVALRLAALHIHQHALANNMPPAKLTVKAVEREFGLERFVPSGLLESMKRKVLRRILAHSLKLNTHMTGGQRQLTQLQAKLHYLDIVASLPSYGAKCFSCNRPERVLLVSPRFGLSQIVGRNNSVRPTSPTSWSFGRIITSSTSKPVTEMFHTPITPRKKKRTRGDVTRSECKRNDQDVFPSCSLKDDEPDMTVKDPSACSISKKSLKTSGTSSTARKRQLELEAAKAKAVVEMELAEAEAQAEAEAKIKAAKIKANIKSELLNKKLAVEMAELESTSRRSSKSASQSTNSKVEDWLDNTRDASSCAYASVAYWRKQHGDKVQVSFIASKNRVAPLKPITVPKLELQGIVEKVYPGSDGRVRVVDVRTRSGVIKRSAAHVALLRVIDSCRQTDTGGEDVDDGHAASPEI
ncbi:unnamed protein product, partial [Iphiclides podalirius]